MNLSRTLLAYCCLLAGVLQAAQVEPALAHKLALAGPNEKLAVCFVMSDQAEALTLDPNIPNLPKPERRARLADVLRDYARASQQDLLTYLTDEAGAGKVEGLNSLWIVNEVACLATRDVILNVLSRADVADVMSDLVPADLGPHHSPSTILNSPPRFGHEPNLDVIQAPAAWRMGYTGQNIVVGEIDTGIWFTHLDLRNHLWISPAYPQCGFNFGSHWLIPGGDQRDTLVVMDSMLGHGTHCAGIVSADGSYGNRTHDTMGVAPSAKMMVCCPYLGADPIDTLFEHTVLQCLQFCVSPTRDPTNGADVITMSLGVPDSYHPRYANYRAAERNVMFAGIVNCVAAGNEASPMTIRCPADVPPPWPNPANNPTDTATAAVITVGATDNSDNAASFTSKGPDTIWGHTPPYNDYVYPPGLTDPDVSAPGVNIFSTFGHGDSSYTTMSGTSMSAPAVAGCIALMLSKNPDLTPREVDSILECYGVRDLGTTGKDNTYGAGRINCSLAVAYTPLPTVSVAEGPKLQAPGLKPQATVVRGVLWLAPASSFKPQASSCLLDVTGRKVLDLHPGANDVSRVVTGVYFVRRSSDSRAYKVVIQH